MTSPLRCFKWLFTYVNSLFFTQINDSRTLNTIYDDNEFLSEVCFSFVRQWNFHPIAKFLTNWHDVAFWERNLEAKVFAIGCLEFLFARAVKHSHCWKEREVEVNNKILLENYVWSLIDICIFEVFHLIMIENIAIKMFKLLLWICLQHISPKATSRSKSKSFSTQIRFMVRRKCSCNKQL